MVQQPKTLNTDPWNEKALHSCRLNQLVSDTVWQIRNAQNPIWTQVVSQVIREIHVRSRVTTMGDY